jgi:hypothetical protein
MTDTSIVLFTVDIGWEWCPVESDHSGEVACEIGVDSELWIIIRLDLDVLRLPRRDGRDRFGSGTSGDASGLVSSDCQKLEGVIGYSSKLVSWR